MVAAAGADPRQVPPGHRTFTNVVEMLIGQLYMGEQMRSRFPTGEAGERLLVRLSPLGAL